MEFISPFEVTATRVGLDYRPRFLLEVELSDLSEAELETSQDGMLIRWLDSCFVERWNDDLLRDGVHGR